MCSSTLRVTAGKFVKNPSQVVRAFRRHKPIQGQLHHQAGIMDNVPTAIGCLIKPDPGPIQNPVMPACWPNSPYADVSLDAMFGVTGEQNQEPLASSRLRHSSLFGTSRACVKSRFACPSSCQFSSQLDSFCWTASSSTIAMSRESSLPPNIHAWAASHPAGELTCHGSQSGQTEKLESRRKDFWAAIREAMGSSDFISMVI